MIGLMKMKRLKRLFAGSGDRVSDSECGCGLVE